MSVLTLPTRLLPSANLMLLGLIASGHDDQEIADEYGLRRDQIGTEVRRMMTALNAGSRSAAVAWGYRHGWLVPVPSAPPTVPLAPRTVVPLRMLIAGRTHQETAGELGISPRGLDTLYLRAQSRLEARSRPHLVRRAIDTGVARLTPRELGC